MNFKNKQATLVLIIAAITSLIILGCSNQERFMPDSCVMFSKFYCENFTIYEDTISIQIKNGLGETADVSINLTNPSCKNLVAANMSDGESKLFVFECNNKGTPKFKSDIEIAYKLQSDQFTYVRKGKIAGRVGKS